MLAQANEGRNNLRRSCTDARRKKDRSSGDNFRRARKHLARVRRCSRVSDRAQDLAKRIRATFASPLQNPSLASFKPQAVVRSLSNSCNENSGYEAAMTTTASTCISTYRHKSETVDYLPFNLSSYEKQMYCLHSPPPRGNTNIDQNENENKNQHPSYAKTR